MSTIPIHFLIKISVKTHYNRHLVTRLEYANIHEESQFRWLSLGRSMAAGTHNYRLSSY